MRIHAKAILSRYVLHAGQQHDGSGITAGESACRRVSVRSAYGALPRITCVDQAVIQEYFREYGEAAAPAFGDSKTAPNALRLRELQVQLERRLSKLPPGFERAWKDRDLLVLETRTGRVLDILPAAGLAH